MNFINHNIMTYDLHGYYGFNNLGDELMLESVIAHLSKSDNIKVRCWINKSISRNVLKIYRNKYPNVLFKKYPISFKIFNFFLHTKVHRAYWIGGNCFYSSDTPALLWLKKLTKNYHAKKVKFYFLGVGIGTITKSDKGTFEEIIKNSFKLYFREENSLNKIKHLDQNKFGISGDLSFNILKEYKESIKKQEKSGYLFSGHKYFVSEKNIEPIRRSIKNTAEKFKTVDFHGGNSGDIEFNKKINLPNVTTLDTFTTDDQIKAIANSKGIVSYRLHSIVVADFFNIPNISINYDSKISNYHKVMKKPKEALIEIGSTFNLANLAVGKKNDVSRESIILNDKMFYEVF